MSVQIPNYSLTGIYSPLTMLEDLLKAHKANDIVCNWPKDIS